MRIIAKLAVVLAVLMSLTACAEHRTAKPSPAAPYTFTHRDFDLRYAWRTSQTDGGVRVEGLIKNVRYPRMEQVQVDVQLLDKGRKVLAKGTDFPVPQAIDVDEYRNFAVDLKGARISQGDLLRFEVSYAASAGQSSFSWKSTVTVNATTGSVVGVGPKSDEEPW